MSRDPGSHNPEGGDEAPSVFTTGCTAPTHTGSASPTTLELTLEPIDIDEFGRRLRTERGRRGLSLRAVAEEAGVPFNTLSRVERGHLPDLANIRQVQKISGKHFFTCNPEQEEEANWLAGALLLPRPLLLIAIRSDLTNEEIAEQNHVSVGMARFRTNATGVKMQVTRTRRGSAGVWPLPARGQS